ncbi:MAG: T9SS type A sorting domain-containing protein, partial [Cryomorphaceae bacterium]
TVLYNKTTAELSIAPVFVISQHEVFGSMLYLIKQGSSSRRYAKLLPSGNFQTVPDPTFIPSFEHNGKVYGREGRTIYCANTDGTDIRAIAELPFSTGSRSGYAVKGDSIFFATHRRFVAFNMTDSTYHDYDPSFMNGEELTYLPGSKHNDRFVYFSEKGDGTIHFYELGEGVGRRSLGTIKLDSNATVTAVINGQWTYLHSNAVQSKNDVTYLALWTGIDSWPLYTNVLIKLNRSDIQTEATLIHSYRRDNKIRMLSNRLFITDEGNLVAQGLFGPEGIENYGIIDGEFKVLKDFIPGSYGSLDWFLDFHHLSDGNTETLVKVWDDKIWSLAAHPHYGMELTYSDGSEQGTTMLSDLAEGAMGLAYFALLDDNEVAYVYAQHEDESYHLYRIGPQLPSIIDIEKSPYWSTTLGSYPEYYMTAPTFYRSRSTVVNVVDDPTSNGIYSLSPKGKAGRMIGDSINPFYRGSSEVYRIQKLNRQSGDLEWSTMFNMYGFGDNAKLALDTEGKIQLLKFSFGEYQDEESILRREEPDWDLSNYGIYLYTFSSEGQLEQIRRISGLEGSASLRHFSVDDQSRISYVLRYSNKIQYHKATMEGSSIELKSVAVSESQSTTYFEQVGDYFVASAYNSRDQCNNCTARLYLLDSSFDVLRSESIKYNGKLDKPQLLPAFEDEIWLACGGNGTLSIGSPSYNVDLGEESYFNQKALLQRWTSEDRVLLSSRVIDDGILDYLGAYIHNGSIVMAYTSQDSSFGLFPFHVSLFRYNPKPEPSYLRLIQFDQLGQENDQHNIPVSISGQDSGFNYKPLKTTDDQWMFAAYSQSEDRVHVDTLIPPPLFAHSIYRVQLINRKWPFESLAALKQDAVENEAQRFANVFPNPTTGQTFIVPNRGNALPFDRIEVYDMHGRFVYGQEIPEIIYFFNIDLGSRLNVGKYVIRLIGDSKTETHHIVLAK